LSPVLSAIVFGLAAACVAAAALMLVRSASGFTRKNAPLFAAFAGGVVITIAVVHLIPEAMVMARNAPWLVLGGFALGFVLHGVIGAGAHATGSNLSKVGALAPVVAIALHSALDGTVYAVTFAVDPFTGIVAATGLLIHEFPEALICFVLLQRAGLSDRSSLILAFLASGATTLAAAAGAAPFAGALDEGTLGVLFAVVAGILLHVGAAHLLHEAAEAGAVRGGAAVFAGAGVAAAMTLVHAETHTHLPEDHDGRGHEGHIHALSERDHNGQAGHRPDFRPVSYDQDTAPQR
jgi:zinc transporter ZupT